MNLATSPLFPEGIRQLVEPRTIMYSRNELPDGGQCLKYALSDLILPAARDPQYTGATGPEYIGLQRDPFNGLDSKFDTIGARNYWALLGLVGIATYTKIDQNRLDIILPPNIANHPRALTRGDDAARRIQRAAAGFGFIGPILFEQAEL